MDSSEENAMEEPIATNTEYQTFQQRSCSFNFLNISGNFDRNEFSRAGFYYDKLSEMICCAFCSLKLLPDRISGSAFQIHNAQSPKCVYIAYYTKNTINRILPRKFDVSPICKHKSVYSVAEFENWEASNMVQFAINNGEYDISTVKQALHIIKSKGDCLTVDTLWDTLFYLEETTKKDYVTCSEDSRSEQKYLKENDDKQQYDERSRLMEYNHAKPKQSSHIIKEKDHESSSQLSTHHSVENKDEVDYGLTEHDTTVSHQVELSGDVRPKTITYNSQFRFDSGISRSKSNLSSLSSANDLPLASIPTLVENENAHDAEFLCQRSKSERNKTKEMSHTSSRGEFGESLLGTLGKTVTQNHTLSSDRYDSAFENDSSLQLPNPQPDPLAYFSLQPQMKTSQNNGNKMYKKKELAQGVITESLREFQRDILGKFSANSQQLTTKPKPTPLIQTDGASSMVLTSNTFSHNPSVTDSDYGSIPGSPMENIVKAGSPFSLNTQTIAKAASGVSKLSIKPSTSDVSENTLQYIDEETEIELKSGNCDVTGELHDVSKEPKIEGSNVEIMSSRQNAGASKEPTNPTESEYVKLWKQKMCHECWKKHSDILFLPCRHLITCESCSEELEYCPDCDEEIVGTVKIYYG